MPAPEHEHARVAAILDYLWDTLEDPSRWGDDDAEVPEDVRIREYAIVAAMEWTDGDGDACEGPWYSFEVGRYTAQVGLLTFALDRLRNRMRH